MQILIINCTQSSTIISDAKVISSLKEAHPYSSINYLTLKSNKSDSQFFNNLAKVHFIDDSKIKNIADSPLFSNAFGINELFTNLEPLNKKWDLIVSPANDELSSLLLSHLESKDKYGSYFDSSFNLNSTVKEFEIINADGPKLCNKKEIFCSVLNVEIEESTSIKVDEEISIYASKNFHKIRERFGKNKELVGVSLVNFKASKKELKELVVSLMDSNKTYPILLTDNSSECKILSDYLNQFFENKLITIKMEDIAITATLVHFDHIIAFSSRLFELAGALNIPTIQISHHIENFKVRNNNHFILMQDESIFPNQIIQAITGSKDLSSIVFSLATKAGTLLSTSHLNKTVETINFNMSKLFLRRSGLSDQEIYKISTNLYSQSQINRYCEHVKEELLLSTKKLLSTLRSLKQFRDNITGPENFLKSLDELLTISRNAQYIEIITKDFAFKAEKSESNNVEENLKSLEAKLFSFKNDLKAYTGFTGLLLGNLNNQVSIKKRSQQPQSI